MLLSLPGRVKYLRYKQMLLVDCVSNVMAHAQKPDFVFRINGRVHLNRPGASVQSTAGSRGVRISGSNAGYTMFRGSVKGTGYPLYSLVSPFTSPPIRHCVPSHFNRTLHYYFLPSGCNARKIRCAACRETSKAVARAFMSVFVLLRNGGADPPVAGRRLRLRLT